jgi:D-aminoacyl-tRNA deacylase
MPTADPFDPSAADTLGIVVSRADRASEHIGEHLLALADWTTTADDSRPDGEGGGTVHRIAGVELRTFDAMHLDLSDVAAAFDDIDRLAFVSRHAGDTGPLLTAHFTGNVGPAEYGGRDRALAHAAPMLASHVLDALAEHAPDGYDVGLECTHHGPSDVGVPSLFVELGSDDAQWDDPEGARAVAQAVLDCRAVPAHGPRQVAGFGGGHYAPRFTRIARDTPWAVGHIVADWGLDEMGDRTDAAVLEQVFEHSDATHAVVTCDDPALEHAIEDLGYRVVGESWLRAVGETPLALVEAAESALRPVAAGLRFGAPAERAHSWGGDLHVTALPADLVDTAAGIDPEATVDAVAAVALAYETTENGTRLGERAALASPDDREPIVAALAEILTAKFDHVERTDEAVVAERAAFDPEKARTLGIEEGPAFGRLAAGEAVTVDGERVPPETVQTTDRERFPLS